MDDIARAELLRAAALDGWAASLAWGGGFRVHHFATDRQRGRPGLHHEQIGVVFVELSLAVALAVGHHRIVIAVFADSFGCEVLAGQLAGQRLLHPLLFGSAPVLVAGGFGGYQRKSAQQDANDSHWIHSPY